MANQPALPKVPPKRNKGLIASLIKGNQWLIGPDHKALFLGGVRDRAGLVDMSSSHSLQTTAWLRHMWTIPSMFR